MAIFHLDVNHGSRCSGQSAMAKLDYLTRRGRYADRDDLAATESGNLPSFAGGDGAVFWAAADEYSRANGKLYNEIEAALPRELDLEQNVDLIRRFVDKIALEEKVGTGRIPYIWAVHWKEGNPHFHLQLAAKLEDGFDRSAQVWFSRAATGKKPREQGGARACSQRGKADSTAWTNEIRATWAEFANAALESAGSAERIDHRSNAERGITDVPTQHEGYTHPRREVAKNRRRDELIKQNIEIRKLNADTVQLKADIKAAGLTRDDFRQFQKQHPSDAKKLRDERRDRNEAARVADSANKQKAQERLVEDTQQQRTAKMLHVSLDQVDATLRLITPQSAEARAALPGIAGGRAFENPGSIHHLRPRFVSKSIADEIELRRQAPADLATQRAVFEAHAKAVRERVAELERRQALASSVALNQNLAAAGEAAAVLRRQWRAGFDRLQVSRRQATIAGREAAVLASKKKVELIASTVVPPVGLLGGKSKQEAHDAATAKKAERLGRAERVHDAAQASLDAGWSEIEDKLVQNRAAAAAVEKAAQKARADELTQLRAQIQAFPKEAATIGRAVDRERIAEVRDRAIADASKPITDEEMAAAAERLRIRELADGHTPGKPCALSGCPPRSSPRWE